MTEQFDVVVSSEVVEHVPCVPTFVSQCAARVRVSFRTWRQNSSLGSSQY